MGNSSAQAKFYANTDIKLENNIRDFELDMGFFRYDFNFIFSKIFIDNSKTIYDFNNVNYYSDKCLQIKNNNCDIKSTNDILNNYFPAKMISFLDNSYFKTKDYKYYEINKLKIFIFLISNDSLAKDADSYLSYQSKVNQIF